MTAVDNIGNLSKGIILSPSLIFYIRYQNQTYSISKHKKINLINCISPVLRCGGSTSFEWFFSWWSCLSHISCPRVIIILTVLLSIKKENLPLSFSSNHSEIGLCNLQRELRYNEICNSKHRHRVQEVIS